MIKTIKTFMILMLLSGCATHLTESGRNIKVFNNGDPSLLKGCEKLGRVNGDADSFLSNGEYGVAYATIDARNKAGLIPHADTLEIVNDEPRWLGGTVTGFVYNCLRPKETSVQTPPFVSPQRDNASEKTESALIRKDQSIPFEKAKKCQNRGGVWVNDTCVIQIE